MSTISGKNGTVKISSTDLFEVTRWTFSPQCAVSKYASNNTAGYRAAVAGILDGNGTIDVKLDTANTLDLLAGSAATLELHVDSSGSNYYSVPAIIAAAPITVDIDSGEVVGATYRFESNGAWSANGAVDPS